MQYNTTTKHNFIAAGLALLIFLTAYYLLWLDTKNWGIGVSHDSIFYLNMAQNLADHFRVTTNITRSLQPMTHYPPLYPGMLAFFYWLTGCPLISIARQVSAVLYGVNVVLIGYLAYRYTNRCLLAGVCASGLAIVSFVLLITHYMAWSEPPFIFLVLIGLFILHKALYAGKHIWLIVAGFVFGLAFLTRYAGLMLMPFAGAAVLLFSNKSFSKRFTDAIIVAFCGAILPAVWLTRNKLVSGKSTSREFGFKGFGTERVHELKATLQTWFFHHHTVTAGFNYTLLLLLLILVAMVWLWLKNKKQQPSNNILAELLLLFGLLYGCFILFSVAFVDASTPLDNRMLLPLFVALLGSAVAVAWRLALLPYYKPLRNSLQAFLVLLLLWVGYRQYTYSRYFHEQIQEHGEGFANRDWKSSELLKTINTLPATAKLLAPDFDYVYLHYLTNRFILPADSLSISAIKPTEQYFYARLQATDNNFTVSTPGLAITDTLVTGQLFKIALKP